MMSFLGAVLLIIPALLYSIGLSDSPPSEAKVGVALGIATALVIAGRQHLSKTARIREETDRRLAEGQQQRQLEVSSQELAFEGFIPSHSILYSPGLRDV